MVVVDSVPFGGQTTADFTETAAHECAVRIQRVVKIEENGANLTAMVAAALLQTKIEKPTVSRPRELKLDNSLQHSNPVPGMMDIGVKQVKYEDVVSDVEVEARVGAALPRLAAR